MLSNCGAREDSWESLGLQRDQTSQSWRKPTLNIHCKDWYWSSLILGKIEGRRRGQQRMRWLDGITDSLDMNLSKLWEIVKDRWAWYTEAPGVAEIWTLLSEWKARQNSVPSPLQDIHILILGNHEYVRFQGKERWKLQVQLRSLSSYQLTLRRGDYLDFVIHMQ